MWPAIAGIVIAGLPAALTLAGLLTLFQQNTGDSYRGRVFGALAAVEGTAILIGTLAGGYLARPLGIIPVIAIQGAGYLIAGILMATWLRDSTMTAHSPMPQLAAEPAAHPGHQRRRRRSCRSRTELRSRSARRAEGQASSGSTAPPAC